MTKADQARELWKTGLYSKGQIAEKLQMHYSHVHSCIGKTSEPKVSQEPVSITTPCENPLSKSYLKQVIETQSAAKMRTYLTRNANSDVKEVFEEAQTCKIAIKDRNVNVTVITYVETSNGARVVNTQTDEVINHITSDPCFKLNKITHNWNSEEYQFLINMN